MKVEYYLLNGIKKKMEVSNSIVSSDDVYIHGVYSCPGCALPFAE
jgi:hypothetical protein